MAKRGDTDGGGSRAEYWRELIEECSASGLTQGEFCDERGVAVASLRWWKWELGRRDKTRRPTKKAAAVTPTGLLPVRIISAAPPERAPGNDSCFEVVLPRGARIRVPQDFDAEALGRLITVVGSAAC